MKKLVILTFIFAFTLMQCVYAQPANDNPCNAISLTVSGMCTYTQYTTAAATATTGVTAPGCASYNGGDVWFSAVVPSNGTLTVDTQTGVITDSGMAFYTGTCSSLTLLECDDDDSDNGLMSSITRTGLTPGATIWIRFWEYGNDNPGTFRICASSPLPITNDNPCNAIALTVNSSCTYANYTTNGATATTGVTAPGCSNYNGGDVWFSAVVPASGSLTVDTQTGGITDSGMAFYTGTCSTLTLLECDDDDSDNGAMSSITRTGLTPGATIWIRFWEYGNDNPGTFGICASSPTSMTNDNPCTAIPLTIGATCNYSTYTTVGATATTGVTDPGCASYNGGDVWFSIVVPANGTISIDTQTGGITDAGMAMYSGTCSSLTLLECDDDDSPNGLMPSITRTGLTPGATIWIRFWKYSGGTGGTFGLCATSPSPTTVSVQDCLGAQQICDDSPFNGNSNGSGTQELSAANQGCLSTEHQSSWYYFIATTNGHLEFTIDATVDYDFAIWGGPGVGCTTLGNPIRCSFAATGGPTGLLDGSGDTSESAGGDKFIEGLDVVAGQAYIMLIDNFAASNTPFDIIFDFNGTNNLLNCTPIPLGNQLVDFGGMIENDYNTINFSFINEYADAYIIERFVGEDVWEKVAIVERNVHANGVYQIKDYQFIRGQENIYRLNDLSSDGTIMIHDKKLVLDNSTTSKTLIKTVNILGQEIDEYYKGMVIDIYSNGESIKRLN